MAEWRLAIDYGTTYTTAAAERDGTITLLAFDGSPRLPSLVAVDEAGALLVGIAAEREMARAPERAERTPKRRLGDPVILIGSVPVSPVDAVAAVLAAVGDEARRQHGGTPPSALVLTHPARWGAVRLGMLAEAAAHAGLPEPRFVAEPVAAAAASNPIDGGGAAAVFDLGGGTFDTAVVDWTDAGLALAGPPGGSERLGGEVFDGRLFALLGEQLARRQPDAWEQLRFAEDRTWRRASFDFRTQVRAAKEALSTRAEDVIYLGAPVDTELRLTRDELEGALLPDVRAAVAELAATAERAGRSPAELDRVLLVGGSSRIPIVARLVGEWFGRVPTTWGDPKSAVVLGALAVDRDSTRELSGVAPTGPVLVAAVASAAAPNGGSAAAETVPIAVTAPVPTAAAGGVRADRARPRRAPLVAAAAVAIALVAGGIALAGGGGDGDAAAPLTTESATTSPAASTSSSASSTTSTTSTTPTTVAPSSSASTVGSTITTPVAIETSAVSPPVTGATAVPRPTSAPVVTQAPAATVATTTVAVVETPAPTTAAPETAPPTNPPPSTASIKNLVGSDYSAARNYLINLGFGVNTVFATDGTPDQSSLVKSQSHAGETPKGTTVTLTVYQ